MKTRIVNYIRTWSPMRALRLVLGLIILTQGVAAAELLSMVLGGAFAGMALADVGCSGTCPVNTLGSGRGERPPAPGVPRSEK
jgi:hypothetical protein